MASGVRLAGRYCMRVCASSPCFLRTRRPSTNTSTYLWRGRISSVIYMVSLKRFYASDNETSLEGRLARLMQNESQQTENLSNTTATTDTKSAASDEGQDDDDTLMQDMVAKYNLYKQSLANIMGKDPETFDEKEIKKAIEYLMPSSLYAKDARPLFMEPKTLYQQRADAVDKRGRPLHAAFFTGQVGFHDLLFDIYEQSAKLNAVEDPELMNTMNIRGSTESNESRDSEVSATISSDSHLNTGKDLGTDTDSDSDLELNKDSDSDSDSSSDSDSDTSQNVDSDLDFNLETDEHADSDSKMEVDHSSGDSLEGPDMKESQSAKPTRQQKMRWVGKLELERKIKERLTDQEYDIIIHRLRKLASHPNAERVTPFLLQFLHVIPVQGMRPVEKRLNEKGEAFTIGHRKRAIALVTLKKGSGNVTVNNTPITQYFSRVEDRKQVMFPFLTVDAVGEYDVECGVIGGGTSGQAGAIRLAISRALLNFEDGYVEPLQQAGLLIRDPRIKERKKPGQKRARKKFAWVRR